MALPLPTLTELRAAEARAARDLPAGTLMHRAGEAVAQWVQRELAPGNAVTVVCGPGNNGGDGFVAARLLAERGYSVACMLIGASEPTTADARAAWSAWRASGHVVLDDCHAAPRAALVIDALLGIGLSRPLAGDYLDAVQWINERHARRLALDLPSGLDAERGTWVGGVAGVRADATLSFIAAKPGLHTADGPDAAGRVEVADLAVSLPLTPLNLVEPADFSPVCARRSRNSHKGRFGNCVVVGGAQGMAGAALIAARAALHLGAGRVFVDCLDASAWACDPLQPELMFRPMAQLEDLQAIVLGCGLGQDAAARGRLEAALERPVPLVLDADALNLIAADEDMQARLLARRAITVLTPHPLEAARLLRRSTAEVQADRVAAARELALATGAAVVLKGAGSVTALASGRAWINPTGGPALATAGTGDALAGMLGALLAQGYEWLPATLAAVWLHGRAGEGIEAGLVAGAVAPRAAALLSELRAAG
jgi:hydroxyethylthiazole kinase-like uncharacterized protein yjeF